MLANETIATWCRGLLGQVENEPDSLEAYVAAIPCVSSLAELPAGTRVLVRGDLDAGIANEQVVEDVRLRSMLDTLRFGMERGWVQVIFGHRGRDAELTLRPVCDCLAKLLGRPISFVPEWMSDDGVVLDSAARVVADQQPGGLVMLENTRRYALERVLWKAKEADLSALASKLTRLVNDVRAKLAGVEVNEGFSASNPDVSSAVIPVAMERVALGFYLDEQLRRHLPRAREAQLVVFSGLKTEKLSDLEAILRRGQVRMVIAAGSLAMALKKAAALLDGQEFCMGRAGDERFNKEKAYIAGERIEQAQRMVREGRSQGIEFVLPVDFVLENGTAADVIPTDGVQLDVGPKSCELFEAKVEEFLAWHRRHQTETGRPAVAFHNGVFGKFEDSRFETGTRRFMGQLKRLHDGGVEVYVGGGEGGLALEKYGRPDWVTHTFTAGGTILKALGTEPIPYLKAMWMALRRPGSPVA